MDFIQPLVWIVIPTRNRSADLIDCINSVNKLTYNNKRIVVVDNHSDDDTINQLYRNFPDIDLLVLEKNYGASYATNQGFTFALKNNADFVLRLDSDTILDENYLSILVKSIRPNTFEGVLSGTIYYYDQPEKIWFTGGHLINWNLNIKFLRNINNQILKENDPIDVDLVPSTGMLISNKTIEDLNGFDEDYLVYYEDFDFCLRAKKSGKKILYVPAAKLWHKIYSNKKTSWTAINWNKSKMIYYRKHANNWFHLLILICYAFLYSIFRAIIPKEDRGNRGPLVPTLTGLLQGLLKNLNFRS
ncbi:MAG: hypothetical protein CVU41_09335 [Chloroflexi bacterium HGW-Chloroflexi-3]|nr:MAG: hypothetical protein CVU41_09335 [Chloroflexi bacterium HGW-Chloroflexi-3]